MSNVTKFYPSNAGNNPDSVLEQAVGEYESVFIIGYDHDGVMDTRASTNISHEQVLWLIEAFKNKMLNGEYNSD